MLRIANLEMHVVHSCNLACESCSHYANQGHKGILSLEEADRSMRLWNRRINPKMFSLLGGEPTIHPDLADFVTLTRKNWPEAKLRLVTNGFFLHRHPRLPQILSEDRDAQLCLSVHHDAPEYRAKLQPILALVQSWERDLGVRVTYYRSFATWTRRYRGFGAAMEPYADGQPRTSWEKCPARYCRQLHEGKIWKCGPLAYLPMQDAKHHLSAQWDPYLRYEALDAGCSDEQLRAFLAREEESYCGMCPANPEKFDLPLPMPARRLAAASMGAQPMNGSEFRL